MHVGDVNSLYINLKAWGFSTKVLQGSLLMAKQICGHMHNRVIVVVDNETIIVVIAS